MRLLSVRAETRGQSEPLFPFAIFCAIFMLLTRYSLLYSTLPRQSGMKRKGKQDLLIIRSHAAPYLLPLHTVSHYICIFPFLSHTYSSDSACILLTTMELLTNACCCDRCEEMLRNDDFNIIRLVFVLFLLTICEIYYLLRNIFYWDYI